MRKLLFNVAAWMLPAAFLLSPGANAQPVVSNITFQSPHCNGYVLTKTGPNSYTIACAFTNCVMVATPGTQTPGKPVTLTSTCTPAPTTVLWTASPGCTAPTPSAPNSLTATVIENSERVCGYYASVSDGTLNGQGSAPVTWSNTPPPPPAAPSGCQITRTPANGQLSTAGGPITVGATCNGTVTSWTWTKNGAAWQTGQSQQDTLPANTLAAAVAIRDPERAVDDVAPVRAVAQVVLEPGEQRRQVGTRPEGEVLRPHRALGGAEVALLAGDGPGCLDEDREVVLGDAHGALLAV